MDARKIDTDKLKHDIDLCDLAGRYTTLSKWSGGELAGPCPKPGCTAKADGFHVNAEGWWKCYQCHPERGDVIELVQWLGLAGDFRAACEFLGGPLPEPAGPKVTPAPKAKAGPLWADPQWQRDTRHDLTNAVARLAAPEGQEAHAYLAGRGFEPATWQAWDLGYDLRRHPRLGDLRPAILIPWQGAGTVKALQYRYIGQDIGKPERFSRPRRRGKNGVRYGPARQAF